MVKANEAKKLVTQSTDYDFRKGRLLSQIHSDIKEYASNGLKNITILEPSGVVTNSVTKELRRLDYAVYTSKIDCYGMKYHRIFVSWAYDKVKLANIHISKRFSRTPPSPAKMTRHYQHYYENGYFDDVIVLNKADGTLVDGYCTYLVAKMFGLKEVEVTFKAVGK